MKVTKINKQRELSEIKGYIKGKSTERKVLNDGGDENRAD